jgi:hypothetical protein
MGLYGARLLVMPDKIARQLFEEIVVEPQQEVG